SRPRCRSTRWPSSAPAAVPRPAACRCPRARRFQCRCPPERLLQRFPRLLFWLLSRRQLRAVRVPPVTPSLSSVPAISPATPDSGQPPPMPPADVPERPALHTGTYTLLRARGQACQIIADSYPPGSVG